MKRKYRLGVVLFTALGLRLLVWPWIYHEDVKTYYWWGRFAWENSLRGYYDWLNFGAYWKPDQPMLMMWLVRVIRGLYLGIYQILWQININIPQFPSKVMQWYFEVGNIYLIKLAWVGMDVVLVGWIYKVIKEKLGEKRALNGAWLAAISLPLIYSSAVWGNCDGLANLLALLGMYWLWQRKGVRGVLMILGSLLIKSSLAIWLPVAAVVWLKNQMRFKEWLGAGLAAIVMIYVLAKPFAVGNTMVWVASTYSNKILPGCMWWLTANAANFWAMIFGFTKTPDDILIIGIISFRLISLIISGMAIVWVIIKLWKNYGWENLWWALAAASMVVFSFMTRMHERYSYPALVPLLILSMNNKKYLKYFWIISVSHMLNVWGVWGVPKMDWLAGWLNNDLVIRVVSLVNVMATIKLLGEGRSLGKKAS
jgi:Gpi18-like mannosyltransferase